MAGNQTSGLDEKAIEKLIMDALSSKEAFISTVWNIARERVAKESGKIVAPFVEKTVNYVAPNHAEQAETIGRLAGKVTHVGVAVGHNVKQFSGVGQDAVKRLRKLEKDVEPYLTKGTGRFGIAPLRRSDNEVIRNARSRVITRSKYDFYKAALGLTVLLPDLLNMRAGQDGATPAPDADGTPLAAAGDTPATRLARMDEAFSRVEDFTHQQVGKLPSLSPENRQRAGWLVKIGTPRIQQLMDGKRAEELGDPSAFELIMDLSRQVDKINGPVNKVMHKGQKKQLPLQDYVMEVFKQHQVDCKDIELNERRSGSDIEEACRLIAEAIDARQVDAKALITLVGDRSIIDHDFNVASVEEVTAILREEQRREERVEKVDVKAFMADSAYTSAEEFRGLLDSLDKEDKAFFASLFPDAVLREAGGLRQDEIDTLKEEAFEGFNETLGQVIKELADISQEDLQRSGLTKKESALVHKWAKTLDLDNPEAFAAMDGDTMDAVKTAVGNTRGYWQDRVGGGTVRSQGREQAEENGAEAAKRPMPEKRTGSFASTVNRGAANRGSDSREPALR